MATDFEIVGRREMPGMNASNPRAMSVVIFYRAVGDPNRAGFVIVPSEKATDAAIAAAIADKERAAAQPAKRITVS